MSEPRGRQLLPGQTSRVHVYDVGSRTSRLVFESSTDEEIDTKLKAILPADLRVNRWNRDYVQKGMTPSGREFLKEALTNMGCADRVDQIVSVVDLIEFDEGRIE